MNWRAFVFLGIYSTALIGAFVFPPLGVWGYLYEWYNHPPFRWWGAPISGWGIRWNMNLSIVIGLAALLHWTRYSMVPVLKHPQTILIILFTLNAFIVHQWAFDATESWGFAVEHFKLAILYLLIVKTHSDRRWLPMILIISLLGCIQFGFLVTFGRYSGREVSLGGPGTFGENFVAPHVMSFVPLAGLYMFTQKGFLRWVSLLGAPMMVNVLAHSQSRGAFLASIAAGAALFILARGRVRGFVIVGLILAAGVASVLFHDKFWRRQQTIQTYDQEGSAMARIVAWRGSWELVKINPLGYGGQAIEVGLDDMILGEDIGTPHNMFFEAATSWGIQGAAFLYGFIAVTLWDLWRLQCRFWRERKETIPREYVEALGAFCSLVAMLVASMFVNRLHWEYWWILPAYTVCLKNVVAGDVVADNPAPRFVARFVRLFGIRADEPPEPLHVVEEQVEEQPVYC